MLNEGVCMGWMVETLFYYDDYCWLMWKLTAWFGYCRGYDVGEKRLRFPGFLVWFLCFLWVESCVIRGDGICRGHRLIFEPWSGSVIEWSLLSMARKMHVVFSEFGWWCWRFIIKMEGGRDYDVSSWGEGLGSYYPLCSLGKWRHSQFFLDRLPRCGGIKEWRWWEPLNCVIGCSLVTTIKWCWMVIPDVLGDALWLRYLLWSNRLTLVIERVYRFLK